MAWKCPDVERLAALMDARPRVVVTQLEASLSEENGRDVWGALFPSRTPEEERQALTRALRALQDVGIGAGDTDFDTLTTRRDAIPEEVEQ